MALEEETWVVTGGAGGIATSTRPALAAAIGQVRLVDRVAPQPTAENETAIVADLRDQAAVTEAIAGADGVLHLGAIPDENEFHLLAETNIVGTFHVLEAARLAGARRVVFASTGRTTGFYDTDTVVSPDMPPRPDGLYGATKVACEALGRLYSEKFGLSVINIRIGTFVGRPLELRDLSTWLSPADCTRAILAAIAVPDVPFATFYGVSRNTRRWVDLSAGEALGFDPQDDAEAYAADVDGADGPPLTGPQAGKYAAPDFTLRHL